MQRRKFLRSLLGGAVAVTIAPALKFLPVATVAPELPVMATIGEYSNYVNFSNFAIASAIDEYVAEAARETSYRAGLAVNELINFQFSA